MENKFVGLRVETIKNYENFTERLKHNTRYKKDKRVVNGMGIITENGQINGFNNEYSKRIIQNSKQNFLDALTEVKSLNKNFRESRNPIFGEGVLYFSEGINKDFLNSPTKFKEHLKNMLKDFEEEKNTKILNYQIHLDEDGNIHVHFIFKNFNIETGKTLNFTRNKKNGEYLQDLCFKHFKNFGQKYERGIKKSKTEKHLSIEDYKTLQEAKKELIQAKALNNELKADNDTLKADNETLSEELEIKEIKLETIQKEQSEIRKDLIEITKEFDKLILDFEDFLESETDKDKLEKLKTLFMRYSKNENKERMLSNLRKTKKHISKVKDKYSRKTQR